MKLVSFLFSLLISLSFSAFAAETSSVHLTPEGFWKTIDDITGKPRSILEIREEKGELSGKVIKVFTKPDEEQIKVCKACDGSRHNQPIIGMVIMQGLKANLKNPNEWGAGEILDPKTGKIYHCSMQLMDKGQTLKVRGYLGISLFGRTQTWVRVDPE